MPGQQKVKRLLIASPELDSGEAFPTRVTGADKEDCFAASLLAMTALRGSYEITRDDPLTG
jgi:hypothetical protein